MANLTQEKILEILKKVEDPELHRDVVALGMVRGIQVEEGKVFVHLEVTTPSEKIKETLKSTAQQKIRDLAGVEQATVQVTTAQSRGPAYAQREGIPGVGHIVAVASGKGGVGKTTVAVNLALALHAKGMKVGLMDGDIYGPNVPLMLGALPDVKPLVNEDEKMIPLELQGIEMISMGLLVPPDQPMVWRGPMLHSAVTQFVQKVAWGNLDFLLVDLPPGTGDVHLSLVQVVPLSGAVIVTTPQEVALMDVRKGIAMFRKTSVPILGIVENMTGEVFGRGGGRKAAEEFQVPFLGEIPLDSKIRTGGDAGEPIVISQPSSAAAQAFLKIAEDLIKEMSGSIYGHSIKS